MISRPQKRLGGLFQEVLQHWRQDAKYVGGYAVDGHLDAIAQRALSCFFLQLLRINAPLNSDRKADQRVDCAFASGRFAMRLALGKARIDQFGRCLPVFAGGLLAGQYAEVCRCEVH